MFRVSSDNALAKTKIAMASQLTTIIIPMTAHYLQRCQSSLGMTISLIKLFLPTAKESNNIR